MAGGLDMAKVIRVLSNDQEEIWEFKCPACGRIHQFWTKMDGKPWWFFDGDVERPTVHPSIAVTMHDGFCHMFIRDGKIEFLRDCTHRLAGNTVEMLEMEDK